MSPKRLALTFAATFGFASALCVAQEADPATGAKSGSTGKLDVKKLEKQFIESMTDVVLEGSWQVAFGTDLEGQAPLSPPRGDRYTITEARKIDGDQWIVGARVEYMEKDVTLPVPVRVIWAGDTPVITLDSMNLPGLGRYSARVMIHRGYYGGVWHGDNYGGVMSGRIIKRAEYEKEQKKKKQEKQEKEKE